jgi:thiamine pyrophosphate-dependent acetolactate synthase large subunit-like protein
VARSGDFAGGTFDPPPDYAKIAEAANGYGENVREPDALIPALKRGLAAVRKGSPAIVGVWLPTLIEEQSLK